MQWYGTLNDSMTDKALTLREIYEYASELRTFLDLLILKLLFPSMIFCWYFRYFVSETYIFQVSNYICIHIQSMQFPFLLMVYGTMILTIVCRQNTSIEKMYTYVMRASGASELRKFLQFHIKKNCYLYQYFVGTSETLSVQMTYLSAHMYRQISKCTDKTPKKHHGGGGAIAPLWLR